MAVPSSPPAQPQHAQPPSEQPVQEERPQEETSEDRTETPSSEIVDFEMLQLLKDSMNKTQIISMVNSYWTQTGQILEKLEEAGPKGDLKTIRTQAAQLQIMAEKFGLTELTSLAEKLEQEADNKNKNIMSELIGEILEAADRAREELDRWVMT